MKIHLIKVKIITFHRKKKEKKNSTLGKEKV